MSADESREGFVRRWSRQKIEAREAPPAPPVEARGDPVAESPAPVLPPVEELTIESDFSGFFHPKVGEDVRRSALRKLFSDPHFNVMDGLDTYIDDYSVSVPIPAEMLAGMKQAQRILEWAAETEEEAVIRRAKPPALPVDDEDEVETKAEADTIVDTNASQAVIARSASGHPERSVAESKDEAIPRRSDDVVPPVVEAVRHGVATSPLPAPRDDNKPTSSLPAPRDDNDATSPLPAPRDAPPVVVARSGSDEAIPRRSDTNEPSS